MKIVPLLGVALFAATPAHATDLMQAWQAALRHDPDYKGAEASRDAGREAAVQARALKRPTIGLQGSYQYNYAETNAQLPPDLDPLFTGSRSSGRAQVGVQAVQPIYDASKRSQSRQLKEKAAGAEAQFDGARQQLILRVAEAFFAVLAGEDDVASHAQQVKSAEQQRRAAQARFDVGGAKITDVRDAEAQRDAALAQQIAAEAELDAARGQFSELTGLPAVALSRPTNRFVARAPSLPLAEATRRAEQHAPKVVVSEHAARAAGAEIDRYRLSGRPVLEGVAGYQGQYRIGGGESGNGIIPDRIQNAFAGLKLTVPLYAGGAISSKKREAEANAAKASRDLDAARRDARLAARKAWLAMSAGTRRIQALRTAQTSADARQQSATIGRDVGNRTQTDVLNAQTQSLTTRRDEAQAVYDLLSAQLQLSAAMGDLDGAILESVNAQLTS